MKRREFITLVGGAVAWPLSVNAQQTTRKIAKLGFLQAFRNENTVAFVQGLRSVGYIDGQNALIEARFYGSMPDDRTLEVANELVSLQCDVIIATGPHAIQAAMSATSVLPIVGVDLESDPVAKGWATSLARPGKNLTGWFLDLPELGGKQIELLKEAVPKLSTVGVLWDSTIGEVQFRATESASIAAGVTLQSLPIQRVEELEAAFDRAVRERVQGMVVLSSPLILAQRAQIAGLALKAGLPTISLFTLFPTSGALMAYGPDLTDLFRRAGTYIDRILKGDKVGELPIERPSKFSLVINLKTAKALGLDVPWFLQQRADEVIQNGAISSSCSAARRPRGRSRRARSSHAECRVSASFSRGTATSFAPRVQAFLEGLRDLGYVEGRTAVIEWRWGEDRVDRVPELAAELVRLDVDVIVTGGTPAAKALKSATRTIPIVIAVVGDPVAAGLVESLARPGGNVTGFSIVATELSGKRLELLKEIVPGLSSVAVMLNPANPQPQIELNETQLAARRLDLRLHSFPISPDTSIESAFEKMKAASVQGLIVLTDAVLYNYRSRILALAAGNRLPAMYFFRQFVEEGGLMSYAPSDRDLFRRAASYVDKVLKGSNPGDLPVQQPTKFEFVINLRAAKALALDVPTTILARADEVIE